MNDTMDAETDRRKSGVYRYRSGPTSDLVSAGDAIRQLVDSLGLAKKLREQRVLSLWEEIVGEDIAAVTQVEGFRWGQLSVSVQNPTWRHWLTFQCETIRQNLNREVGDEVIKTIRLQ